MRTFNFGPQGLIAQGRGNPRMKGRANIGIPAASARGVKLPGVQMPRPGGRVPQAGGSVIGQMAAELGVSPRDLAASVLKSQADWRHLSEDPGPLTFKNASGDADIEEFTLNTTNGTSVTVYISGEVWIDDVQFAADGGGENDSATVRCVIAGLRKSDLRLLISGEEALRQPLNDWNTDALQFTFEAPHATDTNPVTVFFEAHGGRPPR